MTYVDTNTGRKEVNIFSTLFNESFAKKCVELLNQKEEIKKKENLEFKLNDVEFEYFNNNELFLKIKDKVRDTESHIISGFYRPEDFDVLNKKLKEGELTHRDLQLYSNPNDSVLFLNLMVDNLIRAGVKDVTVYTPFIPYQRQDKKDEGRVPISARNLFKQWEASGNGRLRRLYSIDPHCLQSQAFTDLPYDTINFSTILGLYLKTRIENMGQENTIVVSPDAGGLKRAENLAKLIGINAISIDKKRTGHGEVTMPDYIKAGIDNKTVIIVDDIIDTGGSILNAADALCKNGAKKIYVLGTHALFSMKKGKQSNNFKLPEKSTEDKFQEFYEQTGTEIITTDSILRTEKYLEKNKSWLTQISTAPVVADMLYTGIFAESFGKIIRGYEELYKLSSATIQEYLQKNGFLN